MPTRQVPYFIQEAHEVRAGDELDTDWTLHADWTEERRLRDVRNELIKAQLLDGKTVAYRQSGWSLYPSVRSNDLCCYLPVRFDEQVDQGDIVFCQVQPRGYYYAHLVKVKEYSHDLGFYEYWVSNLEGRVNGHTFL